MMIYVTFCFNNLKTKVTDLFFYFFSFINTSRLVHFFYFPSFNQKPENKYYFPNKCKH